MCHKKVWLLQLLLPWKMQMKVSHRMWAVAFPIVCHYFDFSIMASAVSQLLNYSLATCRCTMEPSYVKLTLAPRPLICIAPELKSCRTVCEIKIKIPNAKTLPMKFNSSEACWERQVPITSLDSENRQVNSFGKF